MLCELCLTAGMHSPRNTPRSRLWINSKGQVTIRFCGQALKSFKLTGIELIS